MTQKEKTRRLSRLNKALDWGVEPDPKLDFWHRPARWDALGLLLLHGYKFMALASYFHDIGDFSTLRNLFIKLLLPGWKKPSPAQLRWGCEAVGLQKDEWKRSEWFPKACKDCDKWVLALAEKQGLRID